MHDDDKPLVFPSLQRREEPVIIEDRTYILREAKEAELTEWENRNTSALKISSGKVAGFNNLAESRRHLIHLCLWEPIQGGGERNVPQVTISGWPAQVAEAIFKRAKKLCGIDKETLLTRKQLTEEIERLQERLRVLEENDSNSHSEEEAKN